MEGHQSAEPSQLLTIYRQILSATGICQRLERNRGRTCSMTEDSILHSLRFNISTKHHLFLVIFFHSCQKRIVYRDSLENETSLCTHAILLLTCFHIAYVTWWDNSRRRDDQKKCNLGPTDTLTGLTPPPLDYPTALRAHEPASTDKKMPRNRHRGQASPQQKQYRNFRGHHSPFYIAIGSSVEADIAGGISSFFSFSSLEIRLDLENNATTTLLDETGHF